ncbi:hypothetical protein [Sediminitomix flava]|uniref:Uncharacterized protein n=1 Tax=Sediminitomix flava TaxID=379075 RepID=A0A315ZHQ0_SEDFL|nr:hypothetical protein [Sediminitomix flava]PWJ44338.1 hypothetical protein BC781_101688 [Sediminitomix flava]
MLKTLLLLAIMIFSWALPTYAQKKEPELHILLPEDLQKGGDFEGYVVLKEEGDTLHGHISIKSLKHHEMGHGHSFPIIESIKFKAEWGEMTYDSDGIRSFALKRKKPIKAYDNLDSFDQEYMHFDLKRCLNQHRSGYHDLFLQRLLDGVVQIYEIPYMEVVEDNLKDDKIVKKLHYLVNKEDSDFWDIGINNCYQLIPLLLGDSDETQVYLNKHLNWFDISHLPILIDYYNTHHHRRKWKKNVHNF